MDRWSVERIVHFGPRDLVSDGFVHFGFHDHAGRQYLVAHERHLVGLVRDSELAWTVGPAPLSPELPNIAAALEYPMYVDDLPDGRLVVSNLGNARLYAIDLGTMSADVLIDGRALGMRDMGNCVVDRHGRIWVNEVTGRRVWAFDGHGRTVLVLGDGEAGFDPRPVGFDAVHFDWIYDLRRGPDDTIWVLDSRQFAVRVIDPRGGRVTTIAGTGSPGYEGDGGDARRATFGSDPSARYDGPISLAVDRAGNAYVGDRFNHVVRWIERASGRIFTIAGRRTADARRRNDPEETDPARVNLPEISSMDLAGGRLFVPTDLSRGRGDLVVLRLPPGPG